MAAFLLVTFYATMAAAGLIVEFLFQALGLTPTERNAKVETAHVTWNYTTYLNIVFLLARRRARLALLPSRRRLAMLKMMNEPMDHHHHHGHDHAAHEQG